MCPLRASGRNFSANIYIKLDKLFVCKADEKWGIMYVCRRVSPVPCVCLCVGLRVGVRDPALDRSFTMERTSTFQMFLLLSCTHFGIGIKISSAADMTGQKRLL